MNKNPNEAAPTLELRGRHITLDALLKASGWAPSGGAAKQLIAAGELRVNGEVETRRGRKLRAGDRVEMGGQCVCVAAPTSGAGPQAAAQTD